MLGALWQVIRFESQRTRTAGRIATWLTLAWLPSLLMILLQWQAPRPLPAEPLAMMTFYLVVQVGCMLGLLLWATPAVGSELEAQTWIYVALRPHGKTAILLGKYLVAGAWTASAGLVSAVGVAWCSRYPDAFTLMTALMILVLMSSFCYAALYVLIGVLFTARATVVAVVYTLLLEGVLSTIPATINKFTVCYRLRALLAEWVDLVEVRTAAEEFFGYEPAWQHLVNLGLYTVIVLAIAVAVVRNKEFPVNTDA
jgi:ABC-type transport system involved in multi-copper enzyme maturation permease subunit